MCGGGGGERGVHVRAIFVRSIIIIHLTTNHKYYYLAWLHYTKLNTIYKETLEHLLADFVYGQGLSYVCSQQGVTGPPPPHHHHYHHNHHTQKCSKNQHTREFEDVPLLSLCTLYLHACQWELLWMYLWCSLCTLYLHACQVRVTVNVPLMEFMYLVFTRMPGESYCRRLRSLLLCLCDVFRTLINSLICWFCTSALGLVLFQIYMLVSYSNLPTG